MISIFWTKLTKRLWAASLGLVLLLTAACIPSLEQAPLDATLGTVEGQPAEIVTAAPTETIVWFPPTATWTPFPTFLPSATTEPFPGIGSEIFTDDFSDVASWSNARTASDGGNRILINANRLVLAANVSPATLTTLRSGLIVSDFYAETTVRLHRCQGEDAYGVIFRAGSEAYGYRYVLTCNGKMRADRIRAGEVYPLSEWETSGDIPPGAPGEVKIGVWTAGSELRFFLNKHYQFTVVDPLFKSGGLGYFVDAQSQIGMSISFSELVVNSVAYVSPTPTATASNTPRPSRTPRPTP